MNSIWTETAELPTFPCLEGDINTDVLIIGGGIAGILCAYYLEQAGVDYRLVEADTICCGITKNTTAKISSQHGLIYDKLLREFGEEKARSYLQANEIAVSRYRELCKGINCDFEDQDSYVYSVSEEDKLEKELAALERIGYEAEYVKDLNLPIHTVGAVKFKNQAQFHPLKFIAAIAAPLKIYEHTKVTEMGVKMVKTDKGDIHAEEIIVATHFPLNNKHGGYFLKMYQQRSYVIALEHAQHVDGMYRDEADDGLSFRNYNDFLLLGGGSHRTGKKGGGWQELCEFAKKHYPKSEERYQWATQDCMTLDQVPYIGTYGKNAKGLYVTTGYNKWGMTNAMISANVLKDMVLGNQNEYTELYNPHRTMMRPQLFFNAVEATSDLLTISEKDVHILAVH